MAAMYLSKCFEASSTSPPADVRFVFHASEAQGEGQGGSRQVRAHKLILAFTSDVFSREFYGSMKSEDEIEIKDASCDVFQAMIDFIYGKEVNLIACDMNFICALYNVAEKYNIVALRDKIILAIPEHKVSMVNVVDLAMLAEDCIVHPVLSQALYNAVAGFLKKAFSGSLDKALDFLAESKTSEKQAWVLYKVMVLIKSVPSTPRPMPCHNCKESACLNGQGVTSENYVPGARVRAYEGLGRSDVVKVFKNGNDIVGVTDYGTEFEDDQALISSRTGTMSPPEAEGEIVWARMTGYPWWPAVVSSASSPPHLGMWRVGVGKRVRYHCTFLAWNKETAWMEGNRVRRFRRADAGERRRKEYCVRQGDLKQSHTQAVELGMMILDDPSNPGKYLVKEVQEKLSLEDVQEKRNYLPVPANAATVVEKITDQKQPDVDMVKSKNENVVKQMRTFSKDLLINCDDNGEPEVEVKESNTSPSSTIVRQSGPPGIEKYLQIRFEEGKTKSIVDISTQSKRRKISSENEDLQTDVFILEGEPEFEVVAEYDEDSKLYVKDGQKMDLKTLVENISKHQESSLISDIHSSGLKKLKSSSRNKKDMVRCSSSEVRRMFDKEDPTLPEGFMVREKVRSDGRRVDRYYINREGTWIFRSKPAVLEYLDVMKEQLDATPWSPGTV